MQQKIDGKLLAVQIDDFTRSHATELGKLTIINASPDPATEIWTKRKLEKAESLGIACEIVKRDADVSANLLIELIEQFNADSKIGGILVQLPLFSHLEPNRMEILNAINPDKDVDGLTAVNQGKLMADMPALLPATVAGVLEIIRYTELAEKYVPFSEINLAGKEVVIINHSILIGRPLSQALLNYGATVTICHEHTIDLKKHTEQADILITATGQVGLIDHSFVKAGAVVIDVSTIPTDAGLKGDVNIDDEFLAKVKAYTPVPGGVGPMTTSCLMANMVFAQKQNL